MISDAASAKAMSTFVVDEIFNKSLTKKFIGRRLAFNLLSLDDNYSIIIHTFDFIFDSASQSSEWLVVFSLKRKLNANEYLR